MCLSLFPIWYWIRSDFCSDLMFLSPVFVFKIKGPNKSLSHELNNVFIVGCRSVVQLGGLVPVDPWVPLRLRLVSLFYSMKVPLRLKIKNSNLISLSHFIHEKYVLASEQWVKHMFVGQNTQQVKLSSIHPPCYKQTAFDTSFYWNRGREGGGYKIDNRVC